MLIKIKQNRKWGYYNTETKYEIPCIYEDADNFENGYAIVKASYNEYYIINEFGNKINQTPFTHIELHLSGVYRVRYKNIEHDSFIDQSGNFVTSLGTKLPDEINATEFIAPLTDNIYLTYSNELYGLFHLTKGYIINNLQYISRLNDVLFVICQPESKMRGVCNASGQIIVPFAYTSFSILDGDLILASQDSWCRAGDVYNQQGDKLFYTNSRAQSIGNNLYRIFYDDTKSFVYNSQSNEVCFGVKTPSPISLEHLYYSEFINGVSVVINKEHKYGLIDIDNNVVINCEYEDIYIENGLAYVAKNKSYKDYQGYHKSKKVYGIIDLKKFNTIIECQFDTISSFVNHYAKVTQDYSSGYINDKGELTIKLTHDKISETENPDVVQLTRTGSYPNIRYQFITGEYAFIDTQGHFVALPKEYEVCGDLSEGRILVRHNSQYNYAYADESGKIVIRLNSNIKGSTFNGEYASIWIDRRSHRDYDESEKCSINKFGAFVVPDGVSEVIINNSALSYIKPFEYGIARAYKDYKWGLIDKLGNFICEPKFDEISKFVDHQAIATIKDDSKRKYCIINDRGELLIEYYFDDIELINGEYYSTNIGDISKNGKFIANGKEVDFTYDTCFSTEDGYISVSLENKKGALSNDGNRILNCEYENITYIEKDYLLCQKDNSSLLFNLSSNESIQLPLNIKVCKVINSSLIQITLTSGEHQIINMSGEVVYDHPDISVIDSHLDIFIFNRGQGNKVGLLSISKGIILEDIYHSICFDKSTNSILVVKDKGSHCQRYDYNGNKVLLLEDKLIPLAEIYEASGDYNCGLARVKRPNKCTKLDISKVISLKPYQNIDDGFGFLLREEPDILGNLDWMNFDENVDSDIRTWGYIDETGKEVIACQFKEAFDFSEGLAAVSYFDHFGFINECGKFVTPRKYDKVRSFHEGYAAVKDGFNWKYIQKDGQVALNTRESEVYDVCCNIVRYKSYKGYGFINLDGEIIISNLFYAEDFVNGRARVKINETSDYFTINSDGNYIFNIIAVR